MQGKPHLTDEVDLRERAFLGLGWKGRKQSILSHLGDFSRQPSLTASPSHRERIGKRKGPLDADGSPLSDPLPGWERSQQILLCPSPIVQGTHSLDDLDPRFPVREVV
jgi:hypothetical protein